MKASRPTDKQEIGHDKPFPGFFLAGFECSTHRVPSGRRLDLVAATQHDRFCDQDYTRLREQGFRVAREGIRWHLIESKPGQYDFASVEPIVSAACAHEILVLWDLCHYGWPDDIDIFRPEFVSRYVRFVTHFVRWLVRKMPGPYFFAPINEISFFAWAGADGQHMNPFAKGRSFELKCQLVRAAIEGMNAIGELIPEARFLHIDPLIHIVPKANRTNEREAALGYRNAQFQAHDMLAGRVWPQLGGDEEYLGLIGVNFYPNNEWVYRGRALTRKDPKYLPLRHLLQEVYDRYRRPLFIAETGTEGRRRPGWLRYVCQETLAAMRNGVPIRGICLYPILNHPGWADDRHCHNGLWDYPDELGNRQIYEPLAKELLSWRPVFEDIDKSDANAHGGEPDRARAGRSELAEII